SGGGVEGGFRLRDRAHGFDLGHSGPGSRGVAGGREGSLREGLGRQGGAGSIRTASTRRAGGRGAGIDGGLRLSSLRLPCLPPATGRLDRSPPCGGSDPKVRRRIRSATSRAGGTEGGR